MLVRCWRRIRQCRSHRSKTALPCRQAGLVSLHLANTFWLKAASSGLPIPIRVKASGCLSIILLSSLAKDYGERTVVHYPVWNWNRRQCRISSRYQAKWRFCDCARSCAGCVQRNAAQCDLDWRCPSHNPPLKTFRLQFTAHFGRLGDFPTQLAHCSADQLLINGIGDIIDWLHQNKPMISVSTRPAR